jgi:cytochrome c biogenesis protein CcdA
VNDLTAAPFAFVAGVAASAGPCLAPRLIAAAGCTAADPRHAGRIVTVYLAGLISAYACLGYAIGLVGTLIQLSSWTYAILAFSFTVAAVAGLARAGGPGCAPHDDAPRSTSLGAIFLTGASSAFVLSPCCTPFVSAIGTYGTAAGSPGSAAVLLAVYALGHGLAPAALALGMRSLSAPLRRNALNQAVAIAGNGLLFVLAGYYWCLV